MTAHIVPPARISLGEKAMAYVRLGKLRVYHHFYAWLLAVLLLVHEGVYRPGAAVALGLILFGMYAMKVAGCAIDDVVGFRDGCDERNYSSGGHLPKSNKPLLSGMLTEREAIVFGAITSVLAFAAGVAVYLPLRGDVPIGFLIGYLFIVSVTIQYSWLFKVSYRPGGQEFAVLVVCAAEVLGPYWLIARHWTVDAVAVAALFALGMQLVSSYANYGDRKGDLESGRRTISALAPARVYWGLTAMFSALSLVVLFVPFTFGSLNPLLLICVAPALVLRAIQIRTGLFQRRIQQAVKLGFKNLDAIGLGLAVALVLS